MTRYQGSHVGKARAEAASLGAPLYILSGKFGLIRGDTPIPNYDYHLKEETPGLAALVASQLSTEEITDMDFLCLDEKAWQPYGAVLTRAAELAGAVLTIRKS